MKTDIEIAQSVELKPITEVVEKVGGVENINSLFHCVTRLRFKLKDSSKADREAINDIQGVLSVVEGNGLCQLVLQTL